MRLKNNMESMVRFLVALIYLQTCITLCRAGPLPNITSTQDGLSTDTCSVGDVVYSLNDDVPGSTPCDRCKCSSGGVKCTQQTCEPRPGCKAVHRADHCCPTYQCECEQEGRRYGNGEKLVDPHDPCRLCYCQGGEVVCRKIACFVRDDCKPRVVPGRCCPEYDSCPLRGVTTSTSSIVSGSTTVDKVTSDSSSTSTPQKIKQEITIKEITPVSEIPAITEVKIKEILPSPSSEVAGFSSSKSPLIPREATLEKSSSEPKNDEVIPNQNTESTSTSSPNLNTKASQNPSDVKADDNLPSKISFPTPELTFTDTASDLKSEELATNASVSSTEAPSTSTTTSTRIPIIEEEENPAFPPIPDDLAVLSNHGDEIVPETHMDADHVSSRHDYVSVVTTSPTLTTSDSQQTTTTPVSISTSVPSTTSIIYETSTTERLKYTTKTPEIQPLYVSTEQPTLTTEVSIVTTEGIKVTKESLKQTTINTIKSDETQSISTEEPIFITEKSIRENIGNIFESEPSVTPDVTTELHKNTASSTLTSIIIPVHDITTPEPKSEQNNKKNSPLLNLRSALPTEILNLPSTVPETILEEDDDDDEQSKPADHVEYSKDHISNTHLSEQQENKNTNLDVVTYSDHQNSDVIKTNSNDNTLPEHPKSVQVVEMEQENIPTEDTLQTELSSFPIETSDQKPLEAAENDVKSHVLEEPSTEPPVKEKRKVSDTPDLNQPHSTKSTEATTPTSSDTSATVEIIQNSTITENKAAIIEPSRKNVLKDFISLVGDVASISDNHETTEKSIISEEDEKSQMNASYKSKNSNFNQNSITETPEKSKPQSNKQKKVELEEHDDTAVSDGIPPNDKVEPTTKLPIIDDVSEEKQNNEKPEKKDIEIITRTYVPSINKKPSKVVVKKNDQSFIEGHTTEEVKTSTDSITKGGFTTSSVKLDSSPVAESATQKATSSDTEDATTVKHIESTTDNAKQTTEQNMKTTNKAETTTITQEKTTAEATSQKIEISTSETESTTGANLETNSLQNSTSSNA